MVEKTRNLFAQLANGIKRVAGDPVDRLCDVIAAGGICFLGIGITSAITTVSIGMSKLPVITFLLPAVWYLLAYVLQSIVLSAIGKKRETDYSWEGSAKYFVFRQALPVLLLCTVGILLSHSFWFEYYRQLMLKGLLTTFDEYSIQPFMSQISSFILMGLGVRSAFYPPSQLMSIRRVLISTGVSLLLFTFLSISYSSQSLSDIVFSFRLVFGICFIIYIICAVIIMNQCVIVRKSLATTVAKIGKNARIYEMRIVIIWMLGTLLVGLFAYMLIGGIWYILKFLVFLILWQLLNHTASQNHQQFNGPEIESAVFESNNFAGPAMVLGTIVTIIAVILMIIFARTGAVQAFFRAISNWLASIIAMIMGKDTYVPESEINYRDEIEMLNVPPSARRTQFYTMSGKPTLRDFNSRLGQLKTVEEKLTYSYVVMIELLRELNPSLSHSDTPHELSEKISAAIPISGIDEITDAIELISYAEECPSTKASSDALRAVCAVIEKRLI